MSSSLSVRRSLRLTETAVMLALGTVLSLVKLIDLPYGGSVTPAHILPVLLIAYRYGTGYGLLAGTTYGLLQLFLGLDNLFAMDVLGIIAVLLLDYLLAYTAVGLGGLLRRAPHQSFGLAAGALAACVVRYACHVLSGMTVWAVYAPEGVPVWLYSLLYNATYMLPETLVTVAAAATVGGWLDFRSPSLRRLQKETLSRSAFFLRGTAFLLLCAAVIYDVQAVFSRLQDAETGMFSSAALGEVPWAILGVVSGVAVVAAAVLLVLCKKRQAQ